MEGSMSGRRLAPSFLRAAVATTVVMAHAAVAAQTVKQDQPTSTTTSWTSPRTPDGQPDLEGVWADLRMTPLERPKALAGRASLTDDEVARLRQRADHYF